MATSITYVTPLPDASPFNTLELASDLANPVTWALPDEPQPWVGLLIQQLMNRLACVAHGRCYTLCGAGSSTLFARQISVGVMGAV